MKPIKFDLKFSDGTTLARLDDREENLSPALFEHFHSGKLAKWLRVRKLEELADKVEALRAEHLADKNELDVKLFKNLCEILVSELDLDDTREAIANYKAVAPFGESSNDEEVEQLKVETEALKMEIEQLKNPPKPKITEAQIGQFIARDDGTALDTTTGLTWCRFSIGQRWENGTVIGDTKAMTWDDAMKVTHSFNAREACGGFTDWRLPTIEELKSIVVAESSPPKINHTIFPNTLPEWFWSSSPYAEHSFNAWSIFFYNGYSGYDYKDYEGNVRLVRG